MTTHQDGEMIEISKISGTKEVNQNINLVRIISEVARRDGLIQEETKILT